MPFVRRAGTLIERRQNEHLDDFICDIADRVDLRFYCVPRCQRVDSPVIDLCGDLPHPPFRAGKTYNLTNTVSSEALLCLLHRAIALQVQISNWITTATWHFIFYKFGGQ